MARYIGPFRLAKWHGFGSGKGWALAWVTRRRIINFEFHYERRG